jgi:hypothetical protein
VGWRSGHRRPRGQWPARKAGQTGVVVMRAWPEALRKGVKEKVGGGSRDVVERIEDAAAATSWVVVADIVTRGQVQKALLP